MASKIEKIQRLKKQKLSVGILASDWLRFPTTLNELAQQQCYLLHFDIADGQWSPLFTTGAMGLKPFSSPFIKDVHLMVNSPLKVAEDCIKLGADIITLQVEDNVNLAENYQKLAQYPEVLLGISLCPETPLSCLEPYLSRVDVIQILTLNPQTGTKATEEIIGQRIKQVNELLGESRPHKIVAVDGSMTFSLAKTLSQLDIDWIVSGSGLFAQENFAENLAIWNAL